MVKKPKISLPEKLFFPIVFPAFGRENKDIFILTQFLYSFILIFILTISFNSMILLYHIKFYLSIHTQKRGMNKNAVYSIF